MMLVIPSEAEESPPLSYQPRRRGGTPCPPAIVSSRAKSENFHYCHFDRSGEIPVEGCHPEDALTQFTK